LHGTSDEVRYGETETEVGVISRAYIFWPNVAGIVSLVIGSVALRHALITGSGRDKLIVAGPVFFAAPLAAFGALHLCIAPFLMQNVPEWMPARLFLAYFVGVALLAAATSLVTMKHVRLAATLVGVLFLVFELTMHLPHAVRNPADRFAWAVALRDLSFGAAAWAFAGTRTGRWRLRGTHWTATYARMVVGVALVFFAVETLLHPEFTPGVPLQKITPAWFPVSRVWGYLTGVGLLATGVCLLANVRTRAASTGLGGMVLLLTAFLYLPILLAATGSGAILEGQNFVWDTLLFAGTLLLVARAMPASVRAQAAMPVAQPDVRRTTGERA
jgi:uncharacterized membrane protein